MASTPKLIVNADDFGLTSGVNRAVVELSSAGALTSATLMANGPAFQDAVAAVGKTKQPTVGCHVVLVDGEAVSDPSSVASLIQNERQLRSSLARFLFDLQLGRIAESDIEAEATAQVRRLQAAGVIVSHVDTHKHTHVFPRVARPLMRAATACGIAAIRNPFEPAWSARCTRGAALRKVEVTLLRNFERTFRSMCTQFGLATTDGCIGVSATGKLDAANLATLLRKLPEGTYELVCHPGYHDAALDLVHTRLRETREIERRALMEQLPAATRRKDIQLISFCDLESARGNGS